MSMRRLILMRHGKALWPEEVRDHQRPLAQRGKVSVPMMARWLRDTYGKPDFVVVSNARRTCETFDLILGEIPGLPAVFEPRIYEASLHDVMEVVCEQSDRITTLMVVGHNPGLQDLAETLADPAVSEASACRRLEWKYPTAAITVLEFDGDWAGLQPHGAKLVAFMTPANLGGIDED